MLKRKEELSYKTSYILLQVKDQRMTLIILLEFLWHSNKSNINKKDQFHNHTNQNLEKSIIYTKSPIFHKEVTNNKFNSLNIKKESNRISNMMINLIQGQTTKANKI